MKSKQFLSLLLFLILINGHGQSINLTFESSLSHKKGKVFYEVDYNVELTNDTMLVVSEFGDISYQNTGQGTKLLYKSALTNVIRGLEIPQGNAKIKLIDEFKMIEGFRCQKAEISLNKIKGYVFFTPDLSNDLTYFHFDRLDEPIKRNKIIFPNNLPGGVLEYEMEIPYSGILRGRAKQFGMKKHHLTADFVTVSPEQYREERLSLFSNDEINEIKLVDKAPDFSALDVNRNNVSLDSFINEVVVINFWATWCVGCVAEIPELNRIVDEFSNMDVRFIAVSTDQAGRLFNFIKERQFKYEHIANGGYIKNLYGARPIPRTVVVNKKKEIVYISETTLAPFISKERCDIERKRFVEAIETALSSN